MNTTDSQPIAGQPKYNFALKRALYSEWQTSSGMESDGVEQSPTGVGGISAAVLATSTPSYDRSLEMPSGGSTTVSQTELGSSGEPLSVGTNSHFYQSVAGTDDIGDFRSSGTRPFGKACGAFSASRSESPGASCPSTAFSSTLTLAPPPHRRLCTPNTGGSSSSRGMRTPGLARQPHTPYAASSTTPGEHSSVLVALVEGRGMARGEIGMATISLKQPVLTLSQFTDSQTYAKIMTKMNILQPREILMPNTMCGNTGSSNRPNKIFELISHQYQGTIASVPRKYFNEEKGFQYVKQLCLPEFNTVEMEVRTKYYALAATGALLKYTEFIQNTVYAPTSLKIVFKGSEQTTMIDAQTAKNLQLIHDSMDPRSEHSLFGVLNHTKTPMGARLLKANILEPPYNVETTRTRLDAVSELTDNEQLFHSLQSVLVRFLDAEHLLSLCIQLPKQETVKTAESRIRTVIQLKHVLELVEPLRNALKGCKNTLLRTYYQILSDDKFALLMDKISAVICDDTTFQKGALHMRAQTCFAIKQNINGLLDVARRMYTEGIDDMIQLVHQFGNEHGLTLKTGYSTLRGIYITLHCGGPDGYTADSLPAAALKVTKCRNTLSFTTSDLIKLNGRMKQSLEEIYLMSNVVVMQLLHGITEHLGCLYKLTECVAMLDMLVAFAHNCTLSEYVKPDFTDTLAIKQGVHPILEKISVESPVPNNVYAAAESNFIVITGPNMSGKSTYLRQIALLQIMAQIGSFVPALYASFRVADQIFSRICTDDDMLTNSSTFVLEMREANYIMQNATGSSVVIIDEFGRGIQLVEVSTLPRSVVNDAKAMATTLDQQKKNSEEQSAESCRKRASFRLAHRLAQVARSGRLDAEGLRSYLPVLRQQYLKELEHSDQQ